MKQTQRQIVTGELDLQDVKRRQQAGWRIAAIEWESERTDAEAAAPELQLPYGLRIASDCRHLEEDPTETEVLRTIMRMVVHDRPLSQISTELNGRGFKTREGKAWNPADVFRLMPEIVESGPRIFADPAWAATRTA